MDLNEIYKTDHGDLAGLDILLFGKGKEVVGLLQQLGDSGQQYKVHHAESMDDTLDILHRECIDLLLFDLSLAGSDALENLVRPAVNLNKPYAIIALVDEKDEAVGMDATKKGAEDYLIKGKTDGALLAKSIHQSIKCHHLRHRLLNMKFIDNLTGLLTRKGFMMLADQELKVARRYRKKMFLLFLEVNELKEKREGMDNAIYESILRETTSILRHTFRGADILASFDDGEFAGLAVGAPLDSKKIIYSRLKEHLMKFNLENRLGFELLLNTAILMYDPEYPRSIREMIEEAEALLEKGKTTHNQGGHI